MAIVLGLNAKLFLNTVESYVSPTWSEVTNCKDLTITMEAGEADVTTRGNTGWKAMVATLKDGTLEFTMIWDTEDDNFQILKNAFLTNDSVEMAALDGPIGTTGSEGLHGHFSITKFNRDEKLEEALTVAVTAKLTYFPTDPPEWMVV